MVCAKLYAVPPPKDEKTYGTGTAAGEAGVSTQRCIDGLWSGEKEEAWGGGGGGGEGRDGVYKLVRWNILQEGVIL